MVDFELSGVTLSEISMGKLVSILASSSDRRHHALSLASLRPESILVMLCLVVGCWCWKCVVIVFDSRYLGGCCCEGEAER